MRIPSLISQCESWIESNPCPPNEDGAPRVAHWIYKAALAFKLRRLSTKTARSLIEKHMTREPRQAEIVDAIAKAYGQEFNRSGEQSNEPKIVYDPERLARIANRINFDITPEWLEARSALTCWNRSSAGFLHSLYEPGERIWIGTFKDARRGIIYEQGGDHEDFSCLDCLRTGHEGVWFLSNPVTGLPVEDIGTVNEYFPNGESWRSEENVTSWRYMVIGSDTAPENLWLKMLVQAPLAISAIYTSGGNSIHALMRVDQPSKEEWDKFRDSIKADLITLGACPGSLSAVRLTRLPNCRREKTGQLQRLLYLNPAADGEPIIKQTEPRSN